MILFKPETMEKMEEKASSPCGLPAWVAQVPFVVLSTLDGQGRPDSRAMLNLRNETLYPQMADLYRAEKDPWAVYLTTNASSEKMRQINRDSRASLYFFDGETYRGCSLSGRIGPVDDPQIRRRAWGAGWEEYYPQGADSPDYVLLRFVPSRIGRYADLQKTTEEIPPRLSEK